MTAVQKTVPSRLAAYQCAVASDEPFWQHCGKCCEPWGWHELEVVALGTPDAALDSRLEGVPAVLARILDSKTDAEDGMLGVASASQGWSALGGAGKQRSGLGQAPCLAEA